MLNITRNLEYLTSKCVHHQNRPIKLINYSTTTTAAPKIDEEFKALNLKNVKNQRPPKWMNRNKTVVAPPRTNKMPIDQDWGSVWPGPRSFHPATVPLPLRQGFTEKGAPPPSKFANAELMKIPNFLHLTPPVIKRQCEALKKFCTQWPKQLETDEKLEKHFPLEVISTDYCYSSPTIRDPLARIVTLIGEKYNQENDTVTIVTDRCPLRKQNYDYAMYLLTALYHESNQIEPWEELKTEADMEYYNWNNNASKKSIEALFQCTSEEIPNIEEYSTAVSNYMNEGENPYTIGKYAEGVRKLLNIPQLN